MQRLELTWIGKGEDPAVEPRILLHDASKDYGDPSATNMLIHGDNLLALKALEQEFAGQVKCIYIDPPYNTGAAFEYYDDNLEHSIWLRLMKARLEILSQNPVIIFDGGHNENAINNLRQNVEQYFSQSKKVYIISLLKTKDYKTIIKNICKEKDSIFIFTSGNDKKRYV